MLLGACVSIPTSFVWVQTCFVLLPNYCVLIQNHFVLLPNDFVWVQTYFVLLLNSFVLLPNDWVLMQTHFVLLRNEFALIQNDFALVQNGWYWLQKAVVYLTNPGTEPPPSQIFQACSAEIPGVTKQARLQKKPKGAAFKEATLLPSTLPPITAKTNG